MGSPSYNEDADMSYRKEKFTLFKPRFSKFIFAVHYHSMSSQEKMVFHKPVKKQLPRALFELTLDSRANSGFQAGSKLPASTSLPAAPSCAFSHTRPLCADSLHVGIRLSSSCPVHGRFGTSPPPLPTMATTTLTVTGPSCLSFPGRIGGLLTLGTELLPCSSWKELLALLSSELLTKVVGRRGDPTASHTLSSWSLVHLRSEGHTCPFTCPHSGGAVSDLVFMLF